MAAPLESVAAETFATILDHLELSDLRALRLTSARLCHLATQDKFKSHCSSKRVFLTEAGLTHFSSFVHHAPHLGAALRNLTLAHPVDEDTRALPPPEGYRSGRTRASPRVVDPERIRQGNELARRLEARWDATPEQRQLFAAGGRFARLLGDAFDCLKAARPGYQLEQLRLTIGRPAALEGEEGFDSDGDEDDEDDGSELYNPQPFFGPPPAVAKTFGLAFAALETSQLPVRRLSLFRQTKYPVAFDLFASFRSEGEGDREAFRASLAPLQRLALHFTDPTVRSLPAPAEDEVRGRNERSAAGLRRLLLDLPTDLVVLDLQFSSLCTTRDDRPPTIPFPRGPEGSSVGASNNLRNLCSLRLCKISLHAADLYALLSRCQSTLARLVLCDIELDATAEIVAGLFDFCTTRATALQHFHFDRLGDYDHPARHVGFTDDDIPFGVAMPGPPGTGFFGNGPRNGPKLVRSGADVRKPIGFIWRDE